MIKADRVLARCNSYFRHATAATQVVLYNAV